MVHSPQSPRARAKRSLLTRHGGRSTRKRNLWLVYSPKTDRDWVLDSDRALVHWLYFLEADPTIKIFDLTPEPVPIGRAPSLELALDAVSTDHSGTVRWHQLMQGRPDFEATRASLISEASAAAPGKVDYESFDEGRLAEVAEEALYWMGAISFAAAIRNQKCHAIEAAVAGATHREGQGSVRELITMLPKHDTPVVAGVLVRLAIQGHVRLDLAKQSFGNCTMWRTVSHGR